MTVQELGCMLQDNYISNLNDAEIKKEISARGSRKLRSVGADILIECVLINFLIFLVRMYPCL
jgi:hypothetical protein